MSSAGIGSRAGGAVSARRGRGPELVVGLMALVTPIVAVQGPAHTTLLDAVNLVFLLVYWLRILSRRESLEVPFHLAIWLLLLGSMGGMVSALNRPVALLTLTQDLYLYIWFITLAHFVTHHCRPQSIVVMWVAVASVVALLAVLDNYLGMFGGHFAGDVRATGTFENPNMFGSYLTVSFFLCWATAAAGRRTLYLALPVLALGIVSTASNGALLALAAGIGATMLVMPTQRPQRRVGLLLLAVGLCVSLFGMSFERISEESLGMFAGPRGSIGGGVIKGYMERRDVWMGLLATVRKHPTGIGPGNFKTATIAGELSAHNEYLGMLAERGPLGLMAWCGVLLGAAGQVRSLRTASARGYAPFAWAGLLGLVVALAAHAAVVELFHFRHVWFALALIVAARAQAPTEPLLSADRGFVPAPAALLETV